MKVIHLTDTHLVRPGRTLYDLDPRARLEACVESINRLHADADLCVITGDLAHWGEHEAYVALRDCLGSLRVPVRLVLGNHDDRQAFLQVFPDTPVDEHGFLQSALDGAAGRLLFLDTNQPGTHAGWYCERRLAWLEARLADSGDRPVYLFMHHPPFKVLLRPLDQIGLVQADDFGRVVRPFVRNVRHLFFGHVHRPISGSWRGIPFTTLRATNHQCWLDFTATDLLTGSHEPPAYAIAFLGDDSVVVHFHDFLDDSPKYVMGTTKYEDWTDQGEGVERSALTGSSGG